MKVPYIDLGIQHKSIKEEILNKISTLLDNGQFILGEELSKFEQSFATLCGVKYALGVANGTDALFLSLIALGINTDDEVITAPNSFLASASAIAIAGAKIRFADVSSNMNINPKCVRKAITPKTKAVIAVHLTGKPAPMNDLLNICKEYNLHLIEDCAQAVGAKYNNKPVGSFGVTGCFSLHPLKNLNACGDGGVITTNNPELYERLKLARNHGLVNRDECSFWSFNSRLDNLQAAILNVKLKNLSNWTIRRREIAERYRMGLKHLDILLPTDQPFEYSVYHTFIIQTNNRNQLQSYLASKGIETKIHYPVPIYKQKAADNLGYKDEDLPMTNQQANTILSLPIYPEITDEQLNYVIDEINNFYK